MPDLLRLVAVPVFGWAAYRDLKTRRVPNRTWLPLAVLGTILLLWDAYTVWTVPLGNPQLFFLQVAISLGFVVPFAYGVWWMGGFGGADAKAFMLVALFFPVYPTYLLSTPSVALPLQQTTIGVFSLTILSNTVLVGAAYPIAVAVGNLVRGQLAWAMFIGHPVAVEDIPETYGRLLETPDGFTRTGLDIDALRMYLQWRDLTLADLRADPEQYRNPASLPAEPQPPGDGAIVTDGGEPASPADSEFDPWGAEAFLDDIDHWAYGTTPEQLREGLDVLVTEDDVWISPGIPFLVPMFVGLLVSLTYGDVLFTVLQTLGVA